MYLIGRAAAQFILQYRLFVKEFLQMHFNVVVRKLVFLMQACAQQLNDPTGAPSRICCTFSGLQFTRWRLNIYNTSIHTVKRSELNGWQMSAFDPCICLYVLVKLAFNFINSTGAYCYIKRNACTGI